MSRKCQLTGKNFLRGNKVSHANNKTKRKYVPNLQMVSLLSDKLKGTIQLKVAVSTIRTVEKKGGLDQYLINTPSTKLTPVALKLKKRILALK